MSKKENRSKKIISLTEKLPFFTFDDLAGVEKSKSYLGIILHRHEEAGKLLRLKRGVYTSMNYIEKMKNRGRIEVLIDFLANFLYKPSYLSLEMVLYRHNILTDVPFHSTSITKNKTIIFNNKLGNFFYYKIKPSLFCGFETSEEFGFSIMRATKAKALFDFLYLRKNILPVKEAVKELRLNVENLNRVDIKELKKYVDIEGSRKMKEIIEHLLN
ncbi:MAG: type IV toxin-antitoxin system AbiEi family antitoxin domain-containing protein [bacterium]